METIIQEISFPTTREILVQKSELKLIVRGYNKTAIVSRKVKLNFADAEWWVTVGGWVCYNSSYSYYGFPVNLHISHKAELSEDLNSYSFNLETTFLGTKYSYMDSYGRTEFADVSDPWTSKVMNIACKHQPSFALEFKFVLTIYRRETTRSSNKSFNSSENFNLAAINFWKRHSDPAKVDFTFVVKGKEFKVHKLILEAASPYFERLFESKMKESLANSCSLDQFKPEAFDSMLKFIYEAKLPGNLSETAQELFEVAHYCGLERLEEICAEEVLSQLSLENAVDLYSWAFFYELEELKKEAWKIIKRDILKIFVSMKNEPLTPEVVQEVLGRQQETDARQQKYQTYLDELIGK